MVIETSDGKDLRFKNPGRLLFVVFAFIFWGVGLLDLLGHNSAEPDLFGLYSLPFFLFILIYVSTIGIWIYLFVNSEVLARVSEGIRYVQSKTGLALAAFITQMIAMWVILEWDRWSRLPGLQFAAFGFVVMAIGILLFSNWSDMNEGQWWRKLIAYPLLALVVVEVIIQIVAYFGLLPGTHMIGGDFTPYERIYYNAEGFRNGFANRYGWTFPDYSLDDEKKRVLIVGGSYVQAMQVQPEQQMGAVLSDLINRGNEEGEVPTEVVSIGLPGFGPSPYLYDVFLSELMMEPGPLVVDEIIVLFHLGDDFQTVSPVGDPIVYTVDDSGNASVAPEDARLRHDLTHYFMRGYLSFQIVETIRANYLTPKVVGGLLRSNDNTVQASVAADEAINFPRVQGKVTANLSLTEPDHAGIRSTDFSIIPYGNNFIFSTDADEEARESLIIANSILKTANEVASANNIMLRVVTIPAFPGAFFADFEAVNWESQIGEYDLFLPEKALMEGAEREGIPMLPMGQYMAGNNLTVEDIEQLYFANGQGPFTPQGHEYFANAIFECFFSDESDDACSD